MHHSFGLLIHNASGLLNNWLDLWLLMQLIAITGTFCSGKSIAAEFFHTHLGYRPLSKDSELKGNYYTLDLLEIPSKAYPCFVLKVDAPTLSRFKWSKMHSLEDFLSRDQVTTEEVFPDCCIVNSSDLESFKSKLAQVPQIMQRQLHPESDSYFMRVSFLAAKRSNCMKQPVGAAVVVNNRLKSTGYNGCPFRTKNCCEGGCKRCNEGAPEGTRLEECQCLHGELSAILMAEDCRNGTLYTTLFPCLNCTKNVILSGIKEVVYWKDYHAAESKILLERVGIRTRKCFPFPPKAL